MRLLSRRSPTRAGLMTLLLMVATSSRADAPQETPFSEVFAQLAAKLVGGVVNISTTQVPAAQIPKGGPEAQLPGPGAPLDEFFRDFFGEKGAPGAPNPPPSRVASLGSGFIIDPSGLIVTNNHVIANAEQIAVTLSPGRLSARAASCRKRCSLPRAMSTCTRPSLVPAHRRPWLSS